MNQLLEFLYEQTRQKLNDDDISIEARNVLIEVKKKLAEMLKEELTLDTLPSVEVKLEELSTKLRELKCSE